MGKETVILLVIFSGVIGISLGFAIPAIMAEKPPQGTVIMEEEKSYFSYTNFTLLVAKNGNICEECHLSGKKMIPQADRIIKHTEGGRYCLKCHKISHETHPLNENVTCSGCHGDTAPKIHLLTMGEDYATTAMRIPIPLCQATAILSQSTNPEAQAVFPVISIAAIAMNTCTPTTSGIKESTISILF